MMKIWQAFQPAALGLWLAVGVTVPAWAWQLNPEATVTERGLTATTGRLERLMSRMALRGAAMVGKPVHEDITVRALQCPIDGPPGDDCDTNVADQVIGVRWNDDPAFMFLPGRGQYWGCRPGETVRMVTQSACWLRVFHHGEKAADRGVLLTGRNGNLLVRSHFGDLQFLHAMAVKDEETPLETQRNVMAWMEFTWRTAIGDKGFDSQRMVVKLPIDGFAQRFRFNQGWRIQDLFALGNPGIRDDVSIQRIAFGSLLHVVEDSFAAGHVERVAPTPGATCPGSLWPAPGQIMEFHSYPHQNSRKHGDADKPEALKAHLDGTNPDVIDVVRALGILWREKAPWDDARPYLECVFALSAKARPSKPGDQFRRSDRSGPSQPGG